MGDFLAQHFIQRIIYRRIFNELNNCLFSNKLPFFCFARVFLTMGTLDFVTVLYLLIISHRPSSLFLLLFYFPFFSLSFCPFPPFPLPQLPPLFPCPLFFSSFSSLSTYPIFCSSFPFRSFLPLSFLPPLPVFSSPFPSPPPLFHLPESPPRKAPSCLS